MSEIAIIICTEPHFEKKSLLLARSIRTWAGQFSDIDIHSLSPRKLAVSKQVLSEFQRLNVDHSELNLNTEYSTYGLANKPLACSFFEEKLDARILIFLDSDQIILNEPLLFNLDHPSDLAIRPVDVKNIGIESFGDIEANYWKEIYKISGGSPVRKVKTTVCDSEIFEYYNSGMIIARSNKQLFRKWNRNFKEVMRAKVIPQHGSFFVEQSVLSATVSSETVSVSLLNVAYNYPLHLHNIMPSTARQCNLRDIVSIHYHALFDQHLWKRNLSNLEEIDLSCPRILWIKENLEELKI